MIKHLSFAIPIIISLIIIIGNLRQYNIGPYHVKTGLIFGEGTNANPFYEKNLSIIKSYNINVGGKRCTIYSIGGKEPRHKDIESFVNKNKYCPIYYDQGNCKINNGNNVITIDKHGFKTLTLYGVSSSFYCA